MAESNNETITGGLLAGFKVQKFPDYSNGGGARLVGWMNNVQLNAVEYAGNQWPRVDAVRAGTANAWSMADVRHLFSYGYRAADVKRGRVEKGAWNKS